MMIIANSKKGTLVAGVIWSVLVLNVTQANAGTIDDVVDNVVVSVVESLTKDLRDDTQDGKESQVLIEDITKDTRAADKHKTREHEQAQ